MKNLAKHLFPGLLFLIISFLSFGQDIPRVLQPDNQEIKKIAERVSNNAWVYFKKGIKPEDIFIKYKMAFGLSEHDNMLLQKTKTDSEGQKHHYYQQYYKGIPIEHIKYIVHEEGGEAILANGDIIENINIGVDPKITEAKALEYALKQLDAELYAWQNEGWEKDIKESSEDDLATWKPKGQLVVLSSKETRNKANLLVYRFEILSLIPYEHQIVYINATNGEIELTLPLSSSGYDAYGHVTTLYNGWKGLTTRGRGFPNFDYILKDLTRGYICAKKYTNPDLTGWTTRPHIDDGNNNWDDHNDKKVGASALWAAEKTYDYYYYTHGRSGIDGSDGQDVRIHIKAGNTNTRWNVGSSSNDNIVLGWDDRYGDYDHQVALDIVGHEWTHGIVWDEAGLIYGNESGALNESFADIFGTMVERYAEPSTWDWTFAEDAFTSYYYRSMSNPNIREHPDTYDGTWWINVDNCIPAGGPFGNDYCWVHTNCGVQNHWFYLLSDVIGSYPIGETKAAKIAYWNLCYYLWDLSDYDDAREGSINAAASLYGECSTEYISTMDAWAAVGVGDPAPDPCNPPLYVYITGPTKLNMGQPGTWVAHPSGGGTYSYEWYVDYGSGWGGPYGTQSSFFTIMPDIESMNLRVDVTSGSQQASDQHLVICLDCYGPMKSMKVGIFPNPAKDILNVTIDEEERIKNKNLSGEKVNSFNNDKNDYSGDIIYTLYNIYGQVVYNNSTREKTIKINTSGLQKGHYVLKIIYDDSVISKQIMIK